MSFPASGRRPGGGFFANFPTPMNAPNLPRPASLPLQDSASPSIRSRLLGSRRKLVVATLGAALSLAPAAHAQWTYAGGNLNAAQTYDGLGVDSALNPRTQGTAADNDYI